MFCFSFSMSNEHASIRFNSDCVKCEWGVVAWWGWDCGVMMIYDGANSQQFTAIRAKAASVSFLPPAPAWPLYGASSHPRNIISSLQALQLTSQRDVNFLNKHSFNPFCTLKMAEFWVLIIELFQVLREKQLVKIKWFLETKKLQESPSLFIQPIFSLNKTEIGYFPLLILSKKIFQRKKNNSRCLCCS